MFSGIITLLWIGIPILLIWFLFNKFRKNSEKLPLRSNPNWYLSPTLSSDDNLSQLLFLICYCVIPAFMNILNRNLPHPLQWQELLLLWSILGIAGSLVLKNTYVNFVAICSLFVAISAQLTLWATENNLGYSNLSPFFILWSCLLYTLGSFWLTTFVFKRLYIIYTVLGTITILIIIHLLSTQLGMNTFGNQHPNATPVFHIGTQVVYLAVIFSTIVSLIICHTKKILHSYEIIFLGILVTTAIGVLLAPPDALTINQYSNYYPSTPIFTPIGYLWAIWFNILALLTPIALTLSGVYRQERWRVNLGIVGIFLTAIIKYFDWFFSFMDKSLFFLTAGVLLLRLGYLLEKSRRYLIKQSV